MSKSGSLQRYANFRTRLIRYWIVASGALFLLLIFLWNVDVIRHWVGTGSIRRLQSPKKSESVDLTTDFRKTKISERPALTKQQPPYRETPYSQIKLLRDGKITDEAANLLEIADSERILAEHILKKHFKQMANLMRSTVTTAENGDSTVFSIPALDDHGQREIQALLDDLSSSLQYQRARKIMELLPITNYFGGFGQFDSSLKVTPKETFQMEIRPKHDWVRISYTDPETGKVVGKMSTSTDWGFQYFPGLLQE